MRYYLRNLGLAIFLAACVVSLHPTLASASDSTSIQHIEMEYTGEVAPSDILCDNPEDCSHLGDICTNDPCILVFQVRIPVGKRTVLMKEYIHSRAPVNPEMTAFYVDCSRTFEFPRGSVTARYDTLFKMDSEEGNLVYARAASIGNITSGTGYFSQASGLASASGNGSFDLSIPPGYPVALSMELDLDFSN